MRELKRVVADGELGEILHVEGHYSNQNSSKFFAAWRDSPDEAPGGAMTGTALHVLDAFVKLLGPMRRVNAQFVSRRPPPDPLDTISVLVEFANGASGVLASMRAHAVLLAGACLWHGGSAEALGENVFIIRRGNGHTRQETLPPVDSLRAELDAFVESIVGQKPPPIPAIQMIDTVAAFEAAITSINSRMPTMVGATSSA